MRFRFSLESPLAQIDSVLKETDSASMPEICAICRDAINDSRSVSCGHVFCQICRRTHLAKFNDCPLCRKNLFRDCLVPPSAQINHAMREPPPGTVPGDHICTMCLEEIYEASSIACGHFFCRMCIRTHLATFEDCPVCGESLFSFTSFLVGTLTSKVRIMWEDFFWSIYYPISIIFVVVLLIVLIIYIDPWVIALMAADGLVVFLIHLTIGLDKLREWIPILRDPHRFQRFLVGVLHTLLWILMALSILLHVLELMHFILSAMLVMLESPSIKEITDSQMRLVCSSHLLSSFKLHLFVSGCLHFRPHRKLLLAPPANAAPGAVGWAASTNEQAVVQAEKGAFPVGMGGHEDGKNASGDWWEMYPSSA